MKIEPVLQYAIALGIAAAAIIYFGKQAGKVAGGIVSGNNALTKGTPYENAGIVGTLGAAANSASGGILQDVGEVTGSWFYDLMHPTVNPVLVDGWKQLMGATK